MTAVALSWISRLTQRTAATKEQRPLDLKIVKDGWGRDTKFLVAGQLWISSQLEQSARSGRTVSVPAIAAVL